MSGSGKVGSNYPDITKEISMKAISLALAGLLALSALHLPTVMQIKAKNSSKNADPVTWLVRERQIALAPL